MVGRKSLPTLLGCIPYNFLRKLLTENILTKAVPNNHIAGAMGTTDATPDISIE